MDGWVENELAGAELPDRRLKSRLGKLVNALAQRIGDTVPAACQDWAATKAAYRFFDNARVNEDTILAGHFAATVARFRATPGLVLVVHDTTEWKQPLSEQNRLGYPTGKPFAYQLADLDGDGVQDVVIERGLPNYDGEVYAFNGRGGAILWHWKPEPRKLDDGWFKPSRPTPAIGDLDGDGLPEILLLHQVTDADDRGKPQPHAEVLALDGRTGQARWHWRTPIAGDFNNSHNDAVQSRVTPLVVRLGDGRRAVCIWTDHYRAGSAIVLLDANGRELQRRSLRFRLNGDSWQRESPGVRTPPYYAGLFQVWAQDLDGDGRSQLKTTSPGWSS